MDAMGTPLAAQTIVPNSEGNYDLPADLGSRRGGNLFHSFSDFNVGSGETAEFSGPSDISNILARVTGGRVSEINGKITSTIPEANLFLLNRAGIHFGESASIDVDGAFHASTADYLRLEDGSLFRSTETARGSLSEAAPTAYGFLNSHLAEIRLEGSRLNGAKGQSIGLSAGAISMEDARIIVSDGDVRLSTAQSEGEIDIASPTQSEIETRGPISMTSSTPDGSEDGLRTLIQARNIALTGGAVTLTGKSGVRGADQNDETPSSTKVFAESIRLDDGNWIDSSGPTPGAIEINTTGSLDLNGGYIQAINQGPKQGSPINVTSKELTMSPGGYISTEANGDGNAGALNVHAVNIIANGENTGEFTGLYTLAFTAGDAGKLEVEAENTAILGGAVIDARTTGLGSAGQVNVTTDSLRVEGGSLITAATTANGVGGPGGDIEIRARELVLDDAQIISSTDNNSDGGMITIHNESGSTHIINGGLISTGSAGTGNAGPVHVNDSTELRLDGGSEGDDAPLTGILSSISFVNGITSRDAFTKPAQSGDISVQADQINIANGAVIRTAVNGRAGKAGDVRVMAHSIDIDGANLANNTGIRAETALVNPLTILFARLEGIAEETLQQSMQPGRVEISAHELTLRNRGQVEVGTVGGSIGGEIDIQLTGPLLLDNGRIGASASSANADAGSISIKADSLDMTQISWIVVENQDSSGTGSVGNIDVQTTGPINLQDNSQISAISLGGDAGTISLISGTDLVLENSQAFASARKNGGNLSLKARSIALSNAFLTADAVDERGGRVTVTSDLLYQLGRSQITANSARGIPGIVDLRVSEDFTRSLTPLPLTVLEAANLVREGCFTENPYGVSLQVQDKPGVGWNPSAYTFPLPLPFNPSL